MPIYLYQLPPRVSENLPIVPDFIRIVDCSSAYSVCCMARPVECVASRYGAGPGPNRGVCKKGRACGILCNDGLYGNSRRPIDIEHGLAQPVGASILVRYDGVAE